MEQRHLLWATVVLVVALVAAVVTLSALHADLTALQAVITVVAFPILTGLGGLLYGQIRQVHEQVNGNTGKLVDAIIKSPAVPAETETENTTT